LFDVIAIREAVVAEEIAVVPEFLDDSVGGHGVEVCVLPVCNLSAATEFRAGHKERLSSLTVGFILNRHKYPLCEFGRLPCLNRYFQQFLRRLVRPAYLDINHSAFVRKILNDVLVLYRCAVERRSVMARCSACTRCKKTDCNYGLHDHEYSSM
jgi:hypothetical protein